MMMMMIIIIIIVIMKIIIFFHNNDNNNNHYALFNSPRGGSPLLNYITIRCKKFFPFHWPRTHHVTCK